MKRSVPCSPVLRGLFCGGTRFAHLTCARRWCAGLAGLCVIAVAATGRDAGAQDFQGPAGANYNGVSGRFGVTGSGINIALIEARTSAVSVGIKPTHHLGDRLLSQWDFLGLVPPVWCPDTPSGDGCIRPPLIGFGTSDHATLVADIAAGEASGGFSGVAPSANVLAGHVSGTADFGPVYGSSRAAITWLPGCSFSPIIQIFNLSYGLPGNDGGDNQFAQFLDYYSTEINYGALFVVAAGNDTNVVRKPGDFFNGITVGATDESMQRRLGLSGYVMGSADRTKPEILAPGFGIGDGAAAATGELTQEAVDLEIPGRAYDSLANVTAKSQQTADDPVRTNTGTYDGESTQSRLVYPGGQEPVFPVDLPLPVARGLGD